MAKKMIFDVKFLILPNDETNLKLKKFHLENIGPLIQFKWNQLRIYKQIKLITNFTDKLVRKEPNKNYYTVLFVTKIKKLNKKISTKIYILWFMFQIISETDNFKSFCWDFCTFLD